MKSGIDANPGQTSVVGVPSNLLTTMSTSEGTGERGNGPEDLEDLVDFGITRDERHARCHLSKDGTTRPDVDGGGVVATTEEDTGGSVPESDDLRDSRKG